MTSKQNTTDLSPEPVELLREKIAALEDENRALGIRLEVAEARFHDLADNGGSVVWIVDGSRNKQIYVSPGYSGLWERPSESLYARPASWMEAVHPEDLPRVRAAWDSRESFSEDYRIVRRNGEIRWVRTRFIPIRNEASAVVRLVAFTEDITEWKRLETQLIQSQKMDAVGRLAGGIAHDFNNLLTVINGYSAMLLERLDLADDVRADLASIGRAGGRAASLTAQLLSFSRKSMAQPQTIHLGAALTELEPMLRRLIRENVELTTVVECDDATVRADQTQFEQVIMNLVINARDAIASAGTITIEIGRRQFDSATGRLHGSVPPGEYAMIAVSDDGRGMPPKVQERIFEPFYTTKELGQGTGLGLATVYGIVQQCQGTIWVYSEENVGTTIRIYLPLAEHSAKNSPEPEEAPIAHVPATILLVEDDQAVREIAREVLTKRGYRVIQAVNGQAALALPEQEVEGLDLLVTDVIMPRMGGRELADNLIERHPGMQVLFISGYTENAAIQLGALAPGSNHLAKPFTPDTLARKVGEILAVKTMTA